jgi:hypothetical protein
MRVMRYLLVGNGPSAEVANKARHADAVIQINGCAHRAAIPREKMSHVCVVNVSDAGSIKGVAAMLRILEELPPQTRIVFTRNPTFYWLKSFAAWVLNPDPDGLRCFLPFKIDLDRSNETVSFLGACLLEAVMLRAGMPPVTCRAREWSPTIGLGRSCNRATVLTLPVWPCRNRRAKSADLESY